MLAVHSRWLVQSAIHRCATGRLSAACRPHPFPNRRERARHGSRYRRPRSCRDHAQPMHERGPAVIPSSLASPSIARWMGPRWRAGRQSRALPSSRRGKRCDQGILRRGDPVLPWGARIPGSRRSALAGRRETMAVKLGLPAARTRADTAAAVASSTPQEDEGVI